jgi:hypothetical protein
MERNTTSFRQHRRRKRRLQLAGGRRLRLHHRRRQGPSIGRFNGCHGCRRHDQVPPPLQRRRPVDAIDGHGTLGAGFQANIDSRDNLAFRTTLNNPLAYNAALDNNGDGVINTGDNLQFRNRFNPIRLT